MYEKEEEDYPLGKAADPHVEHCLESTVSFAWRENPGVTYSWGFGKFIPLRRANLNIEDADTKPLQTLFLADFMHY